jgi:hypothetical protein
MIDIQALSSFLTAVFTAITGIAGTIIAVQLYALNRHQHKDAWIKTYTDLHQSFWNDPVMAKVRYWINYDRAYLEIKPILQKRRNINDGKLAQEELQESEYKCLDDLDKFYNLVLEVKALNAHLKVKFDQEFWTRLYFNYWASKRIQDEKRAELRWYVERFYPELLNPTLQVGEVEKKNTYETVSHIRQ